MDTDEKKWIQREEGNNLILRLYLLISLSISAISSCSPQTNITQEVKKITITEIARLLKEHYIFLNVAENCIHRLQTKLNAGVYDGVSDKKMFAELLTTELQNVSRDKHLEVRVRRTKVIKRKTTDPIADQFEQQKRRQKNNYYFKKVEILEGNIGYIDLRAFCSLLAKKTAASAMQFVSHCDAIIFDMRKNSGGYPDLIYYICSYFFDKKILLNTMYYRKEDFTLEFWSTEEVIGKKMPKVPLFVLTGKETFSAPEDFAYTLQSRKRATVIGEVTGGGANITSLFTVNEQFEIYIPKGRSINPVTGTNWEGIGVQPDIITPAEKTLSRAIKLAKIAAKKFRQEKNKQDGILIKKFEAQIKDTETLYRGGEKNAAENKIFDCLAEMLEMNLIDEDSINRWGYWYLRKGNKIVSMMILKYNTLAFPNSANVYDSYGDILMENGKHQLAIENYEKSLKLNPKNKNAIEKLKKLKGR